MSGDAGTRPRGAAAEPERMLPLVRGGIGLLLVLAIANGVFLYFFPSQAKTDYAWSIALPVSAAFMGAGYLAGVVATALGSLAARYWRSVRVIVPAFAVLGLTLSAATLIHTETFRWDYAPTWGWTAVYALLPPAAGYFWLLHERDSRDRPEPDPRLRRMPLPAVALGLVLAIVGIALFVAPDGLLERWPWTITPLLARVFAGWYLLGAVTLLFAPVSVRRPHEVPIAAAAIATWCALVLLLPALYSDSVDTGAAGFWPLLALHAVVLVACAAAAAGAARLMRADGGHL